VYIWPEISVHLKSDNIVASYPFRHFSIGTFLVECGSPFPDISSTPKPFPKRRSGMREHGVFSDVGTDCHR
jgi:hypothetical protein